MLYNYYLEPPFGSFQRIFRENMDTGDIEVADYPEYQRDANFTRWYYFSAGIPDRAKLIGAGGLDTIA